jgi:flavin-dependent dehydrogenase
MNTRGNREVHSNVIGGHAVVLGGSLAGLLAARVLAEHFEHVTLIERDAYPETAEVRFGRALLFSVIREAIKPAPPYTPASKPKRQVLYGTRYGRETS